MHADSARLNDPSGQVIGCAFTVLNTLGVGSGKKLDEHALAQELRAVGLTIVQPVNDVLLVEPKTVKVLDDAHRVQCTNHPKATGL